MIVISDIAHAIVHGIHAVSRAVGFVLGIHLFIVLQTFRILFDDPIGSLRSAAPTSPLNNRDRSDTQAVPLHLPALGPRPDDLPLPPAALGRLEKLRANVMIMSARLHDEAVEIGERIDSKGGASAKLLSALSLGGRGGGGRNLNAELVKKLPPEIVSYILLLAASPHTPDAVPCKIALLSKAHYRLVIPKLYAHVQLNDGHTFRRFRLTMALHNPSLGRLVKSLQIASADFDDSGYLPGQLAENVALGVGLEQILLACSNLSDLYLDLLAMAALHNGTASRLERGALPVRLSAELSIPQYLAVPTFASLRHVELNVFGLDADAIEDLRTVLPRLKSLTFRWVTRGSYRPPALRNVLSAYDWRGARGVDRRRRRRPSMSRQGSTSSLNSSGGSGSGNMHHHGGAFSHEESQDMSIDDDDDETEEERAQWRPGGRKHSDLCLFAHAIDVLRRWPQEPSDGKPLRALTVLAWPKAVRMLREFFPDAVLLDETGSADEQAWDWSMERAYDEDDEEEGKGEEQDGGEGGRGGLKKRPNFSRASRRMGPAGHRPPPVHVQAAGGPATMGVRMARNPSSLSQHSRSGDTKLAPLRIGIDDAYQQGPRRGPLQQWQARTASCDIWR